MKLQASRISSFNVALLVASIVVGFLLTIQFRSAGVHLPEREHSRLASTDAVLRLEDEQRQLKERIGQLRSEIALLQRTTEAAAVRVSADLDHQKLLAGLIAVHGPGIIVALDDSIKATAPTDDLNNYIVHDYDLRDVVNLLWLAGAEAIAINGERLVNVSSIYCVGSTILVNDTRLSPPYEVRAIGDPARLEETIQDPKNLVKLRSRVKTYGVQFRVVQQKDVTIPAYSGNLNIRYARPTVVPERNEGRKLQGM